MDVVAAEPRIAQRGEREAPLMPGVDDVPDRRRFRHDSEPAERIGALEDPERLLRDALPRHAVESVAAGDEVAFERLRHPAFVVSHLRRGLGQIVEANIPRLLDDPPAVAVPDSVELLGDRGLPVGHHRLARVGLGVDKKRLAALPDYPAAVMFATFSVQPLLKPSTLERASPIQVRAHRRECA